MDSHIIVNVLCIIPIFIGGYLTYKKFQDGLFTYKNFIAFTIYILAGLFFSIKKYDFSPFGLFCEFLIFAFFISIFLLIVSIKNRFQKGIVASLIIMALFFVAVLLTGNKEIPNAESTFESIKFTLIFVEIALIMSFLSPLLTGFLLYNFFISRLNNVPFSINVFSILDLIDIDSIFQFKLFKLIILIVSTILSSFDVKDFIESHSK